MLVGLIGPNGSGKSTLLRTIARTHPILCGRVLLDGVEVSQLRPAELARRVAVVPQHPTLPEAFTDLDLVLLGRTPHLGCCSERDAATEKRWTGRWRGPRLSTSPRVL